MFQFRKSLTFVAALALGSFTLMPAYASAVVDYPEDTPTAVDLSTASCKIGGTTVTITSSARAGEVAPAGTTTIKAFGKTFTKKSGDVTVSVKSPTVTKRTNFKITSKFVPKNVTKGAASPQSATQATTASFTTANPKAVAAAYLGSSATTSIALTPTSPGCTPGGANNAGFLPGTGGASIWYLVIGAALLAFGTAVVVRARRSHKYL